MYTQCKTIQRTVEKQVQFSDEVVETPVYPTELMHLFTPVRILQDRSSERVQAETFRLGSGASAGRDMHDNFGKRCRVRTQPVSPSHSHLLGCLHDGSLNAS